MKNSVVACFFFLIFISGAYAQDRRSSAPYITGDGFRDYCDYIFDETGINLIPENVRHGNTIFVKTDLLSKFFNEYHPKITEKYILVSHNSDYPAPGAYSKYLDDPTLIAWFAQNMEGPAHPKLHPIPIGLENRYNNNGNPAVIDSKRKEFKHLPRSSLAYMNINVGTNPSERGIVYDYFKDKPFCKNATKKPFVDYLKDLATSKFVLSPRGNGLDCHRTWESLYMGSYPIVKTSASDEMYADLPVIIVNDWKIIDANFLNKKYKEIKKQSYNKDKIYLDYWLNLIESYKHR